MTVRPATDTDLAELMEMCVHFAEASPYASYVTEDKLLKVLNHVMADPNSLVLIAPGEGMLIATVNQFIFGEIKQATEIAWWVEPASRKNGVGKSLLELYEQWAFLKGCKIMSLVCLDQGTGEIYTKRGLKPAEWNYFKEL